jgi:hypothetical protein
MEGPIGVILIGDPDEAMFIIEGCEIHHMDYELHIYEGLHFIFIFDAADFAFLEYVILQEGMACFPLLAQ